MIGHKLDIVIYSEHQLFALILIASKDKKRESLNQLFAHNIFFSLLNIRFIQRAAKKVPLIIVEMEINI